ncbi:MAG: hypothetical protein CMJ74_13370 [Planctomycetaceae bacterium]|nr:hypothetical protein [Planctomycetaceae bacterium]
MLRPIAANAAHSCTNFSLFFRISSSSSKHSRGLSPRCDFVDKFQPQPGRVPPSAAVRIVTEDLKFYKLFLHKFFPTLTGKIIVKNKNLGKNLRLQVPIRSVMLAELARDDFYKSFNINDL